MAINRRPRPNKPNVWTGDDPMLGAPRDKVLSIRLPADLHARLKFLAKESGTTMSEICIRSMLSGKPVR